MEKKCLSFLLGLNMSEKIILCCHYSLEFSEGPSYLETLFLCCEKMICSYFQTLMSILKSFIFPGILKVYEGITQVL